MKRATFLLTICLEDPIAIGVTGGTVTGRVRHLRGARQSCEGGDNAKGGRGRQSSSCCGGTPGPSRCEGGDNEAMQDGRACTTGSDRPGLRRVLQYIQILRNLDEFSRACKIISILSCACGELGPFLMPAQLSPPLNFEIHTPFTYTFLISRSPYNVRRLSAFA